MQVFAGEYAQQRSYQRRVLPMPQRPPVPLPAIGSHLLIEPVLLQQPISLFEDRIWFALPLPALSQTHLLTFSDPRTCLSSLTIGR
jgi:hypothetical protein